MPLRTLSFATLLLACLTLPLIGRETNSPQKHLPDLEKELKSAGFNNRYRYYTHMKKSYFNERGIVDVLRYKPNTPVFVFFIEHEKALPKSSVHTNVAGFLATLKYSEVNRKRILATLYTRGRFSVFFFGCPCEVPSDILEVFKDF